MQNTVVLTVRDVNDPEFLKGIPAGSHGVVAGFNQIFKREAIASLQSLVNFHSSVLPLYRGPIPSYWVLRNREERTGYTIHRVTERIDGGEVLFQEAISCDGAKSAEDLDRRIARSAQSTFVRYLDHILYGQEWNPVKLDAFSIYRTRLDYGRRPTEYSFFNKNLESTGTSRETRA
jgi:methionyl-tRNA formyltransferase